MRKIRLLFICSGNRDRSPTAEDIFAGSEMYEARSAGTDPSAVRPITQQLVNWADKILVMSEREDGHLTFLAKHFDLEGKEIHDLEILDRYQRGASELVHLLKAKLSQYLTPQSAEGGSDVLTPTPPVRGKRPDFQRKE